MVENADYTVVIPTRNEAGGLRGLLEQILKIAPEVIVIDGHSSDGTADIARELGVAVHLDNRKGKGDGLRVGIEKASHDIIVFIDADGSHDPSDIPALVRPIIEGRADMAVASRVKGGSDDFYLNFDNLIRQVGSQIATFLVNRRFNVKLTDIQNGFRAIKKNVAIDLKLSSDDFEIEEEMVIRCLKNKYHIEEVASHEYERKWGMSKLPTSKGWSMLYTLLKELYL